MCLSCFLTDMAMHAQSGMSTRSSSKRGVGKNCQMSNSEKDICSELKYLKYLSMRICTDCKVLCLTFLKVSDNIKIDLVRLVDRSEGIHPILTETLMEAGTQAVDNIFLKVTLRLTHQQ